MSDPGHGEERFDVVIEHLPPGSELALQRVFGIDAARAAALVSAVPVVVRRAAPVHVAQQFLLALMDIDATARLDRAAPRLLAPSTPQPATPWPAPEPEPAPSPDRYEEALREIHALRGAERTVPERSDWASRSWALPLFRLTPEHAGDPAVPARRSSFPVPQTSGVAPRAEPVVHASAMAESPAPVKSGWPLIAGLVGLLHFLVALGSQGNEGIAMVMGQVLVGPSMFAALFSVFVRDRFRRQRRFAILFAVFSVFATCGEIAELGKRAEADKRARSVVPP